LIHITDSQTDRILDVIDEDEFWEDKHYKSLKDTLETFDFVTFADKRFSEHLAKRNRIIIPDEDGKYVEFVIENTRKYRDSNGGLYIEVYTSATYIELTKAKVIKPQTLSDQTVSTAVSHAIGGTEWEAGTIANVGTRTFVIEEHTNPYSFLKRIASEFDLELHFRVEVDGNKVVRRYVDLVERVGMWRGREVEFGKDLIGIERKEDFSNIVTALIGLGPERENGTRLEVFVEDKDALARWGRNGQHLIEVYEPESTDQTMTEERLRELTQNELEKRINSIVEYTADIADLEKVPGLEHEKIRFGDTIKIKDTGFNPPLYLEARVHTIERSIKKNGYKTVTLGDYIEYTEEQVFAIWKSLKAEIAKKVSLSDVMEVTYTKTEIDDKDAGVYQDSTQYSDVISETKKQEAIQVAAEDATEKANQAKQEAVEQAESIAEQKKQLAIQAAIADAETKINAAKTALEADIATKVDAQWVNGQLVLKENAITKSNTAPVNPTVGQLWVDTSITPNVLKRWSGSAWVKASPTSAGEVGAYTKTEVDNALNSKVSVTQYNTDMNGVITRLDSAESRITQTENEIATKVSNTTYQQDKAALENDISALETRMTNAETSITQNANQIALKANKTDVYTKTEIDGQFSTVNQQISQLNAELSVQAGEIATKVSKTEFESLQIGGRNLLRNTDFRSGSSYWILNNATITPNLYKGYTGLTKPVPTSGVNDTYADFLAEPNVQYTLSFYAKGKFQAFLIPMKSEAPGWNPTDNYHDNRIFVDSQTDFTLITKTTLVTPPDTKRIRVIFRTEAGNPSIVYIALPKVEKGNRATDWTPATEDVQGQIDSLGTRVNSAETSITQLSNQIQLKANQSTVDTLANRISSAESTLTIHTNQIASKVSQTDFNGNTIASLINQTATTIKLLAERIEFAGHVFGEDATFSGNIEVRKTVDNQVFDNMFNGDEFRFVKFKKGITNPNTKNIDLSQVENMAKIFYDGVAFANSSQSMGLGLSGITHSGLLNVYANRIAMSAVSAVEITSPVSIWGNTDVWGSLTADTLKSRDTIEFGADGRLVNDGVTSWIQGNEIRATKYKTSADYVNFRANWVYAESLDINTGVNLYIRPTSSGNLRVTATGTTNNWRPVEAGGFENRSQASIKQDIELWTGSALNIINRAQIYQYRLKTDVANGIDKLKYSLVIGDGFNTPEEFLSVSGESIDVYVQTNINTKAIQELDYKINDNKDEIEWLKLENQYLKQKVSLLESRIQELEAKMA